MGAHFALLHLRCGCVYFFQAHYYGGQVMPKPTTTVVYPVDTPRYAEKYYDPGLRQFVIAVHETSDPKSGVEFRAKGSTEEKAKEDLRQKGFHERGFAGSTKHNPNFDLIADFSCAGPVMPLSITDDPSFACLGSRMTAPDYDHGAVHPRLTPLSLTEDW